MPTALTGEAEMPRDPFDTAVPPELLSTIQDGVMRYTYRGVLCNKSPFDLALYLLLLQRLRPRTIVEIGTKRGGSVLWFADMAEVQYGGAEVIAIDNAFRVERRDPRIRYLDADANDLAPVLDPGLLAGLRRPWLVVEDSAHTFETCTAVLEFFHPHLESGDYIVIEDGNLRAIPDPQLARYQDGPSRAIGSFLDRHPEYEVDRELCDFFGYNVTYNLSGYLRKAAG